MPFEPNTFDNPHFWTIAKTKDPLHYLSFHPCRTSPLLAQTVPLAVNAQTAAAVSLTWRLHATLPSSTVRPATQPERDHHSAGRMTEREWLKQTSNEHHCDELGY
jgi:hypothetical protein